MNNSLARFFYKFKVLRRPFKNLVKNKTIRQTFFNGSIFFNVVEFPFYWLNNASCEKVDREIQDKLLEISFNKDYFIDIGANVGLMTLSVALRNKNITVIAYDPNAAVLKYLNRSIKKNSLEDRIQVINAAVSNKAGKTFMDFSQGPYSGHFSTEGTEVDIVDFNDILDKYHDERTLFKLDVEGFEFHLIPIIIRHKNSRHIFMIEMHPKGHNGLSDPQTSLMLLLENNFIIKNTVGEKLNSGNSVTGWENIICSYNTDNNY
ncbi:MAG TPA: FkbM family methyltransferase [Chitinophagaceae bacterium]|nr:FkbM family methyltransferase [Chitinophagaceae bacterium]